MKQKWSIWALPVSFVLTVAACGKLSGSGSKVGVDCPDLTGEWSADSAKAMTIAQKDCNSISLLEEGSVPQELSTSSESTLDMGGVPANVRFEFSKEEVRIVARLSVKGKSMTMTTALKKSGPDELTSTMSGMVEGVEKSASQIFHRVTTQTADPTAAEKADKDLWSGTYHGEDQTGDEYRLELTPDTMVIENATLEQTFQFSNLKLDSAHPVSISVQGKKVRWELRDRTTDGNTRRYVVFEKNLSPELKRTSFASKALTLSLELSNGGIVLSIRDEAVKVTQRVHLYPDRKH